METTKTGQWVAAMDAAGREGLKAEKITDTLYAVRSTSKATCHKHLVSLDARGKITRCSDCPGWEHYLAGHARPCKHAGAVARRLLRERHIPMPQPAIEDNDVVESAPTTRQQVFRAA